MGLSAFPHLGVDFLNLFLGLLIDESHHVLDLLLHVRIAQSHLGILLNGNFFGKKSFFFF